MKKKMALVLSLVMVTSLFAGCSSKAPADNKKNDAAVTEDKDNTVVDEKKEEEPAPAAGGALKTGLGVITKAGSSKDAADEDGLAQVDSTFAAVTVDENGVITNCIIDGIQTKVNFSKEGKLVTALDTTFPSKNELGEAYGMKAASSIGKEWNEQAQAFADYTIGKTAEEVAGTAVTEGLASDADLKASVTVHVTDFMAVVQKAVANAADLGAQAGDKLGLSTTTGIAKSTDVADKDGLAEAYSSYSVVTVGADGKITSCIIDASQGQVSFDATGKITSDLAAEIATKNELGDAYGMKAASSIGKEWNEQAAGFAAYVTGKTADEVKGIAVDQGLATDADLLAAVTVHVTDFMTIVSNAVAGAK